MATATATEKLLFNYLDAERSITNIGGLATRLEVPRAALTMFLGGQRGLSEEYQQKIISYLNRQAQALALLTTQLNG